MAHIWYYNYIKNGTEVILMAFDDLIQLAMDNLLYTGIGIAVILFIFFRLWKTIRIHIGAKRYVKKARKLRKKKWNGIQLVDKVQRKRKKGTNTYNKLKGGGKKRVKKYFSYKVEELPVITKYSYGKLLKRSSDKLIIFARNERKIVKKVVIKKGLKNIIDITNKYQCLDEMIHFLHNLPEAIMEQQDYDIFLSEQDISIGYKIK